MKKFVLAFCLILISTSILFSQEGWFWQNPLPQGQDLNAVDFVDTNIGWAVGEGGTILKTMNGGTTWTLQSSGIKIDLNDVSFIDADMGTVVGYDYSNNIGIILKTTNGGINWISQSSGTKVGLNSVTFTDADNGWAVGGGGTILRTINSGITVMLKLEMDFC